MLCKSNVNDGTMICPQRITHLETLTMAGTKRNRARLTRVTTDARAVQMNQTRQRRKIPPDPR